MAKIAYKNTEFDSFHEAICAALFDRYDWDWVKPSHSINGWRPDFLLKGETSVYVECKGSLKWDNVRNFPEWTRYEDAVAGSSDEVLLIPESPKRIKNNRGYPTSVIGFLYDGDMWSYAAIGRWAGRVGFCHSANSWKDRISGENVNMSSGDGQQPNIEVDWRSATQTVRGKRVSFFKAFVDSKVEEWKVSS